MQQTSQVDIAPLLDQGTWSGYQKIVLALCALIVIFDGLDIQVIGVAIPALMKDWGLPRSAFSLIAAIGLAGMAIGAIFGGFLGDRFGRRPTLIGSVFVFSILTILSAFVPNVEALTWLRLATGVGLGSALPNVTALIAEFTPLKNRALSVILTIVCVPLGGVVAGALASNILPTSGSWHTLYIVCGVLPGVVGLILIAVLPESPRYLVRFPERRAELAKLFGRMGKPVGAAALVDLAERDDSRSPFSALFSPTYRRDTILLWLEFFTTLGATYVILNWLPALLTGLQVNIGVASSGITYYNLGGIVGSIAGALLIGRMGSRIVMLGLVTGAVLTAIYLSQTHIDPADTTALLATIGLLGLFMNALQTSSYALAAQIYVSHIRATGTGSALAIGRVGGVISSFVGSYIIGLGGSSGYFGLVATCLVVSLVALALISRHVPANLGKST
jgi:AAHS family 4-hydroxybenzoate transporter-like MFS transporter